MKFPAPLVPGRLQRRYKRFLSDIVLDSGEHVVAHCPNPGSMMGLAEDGMAVWLSAATNPARKLRYSWELVAPDAARPDRLVGINTGLPNALVEEALGAGRIPELAGYRRLRREVRYGLGSRIDLLLEDDGVPPCYVEIKSVTLRRNGPAAEFPDAVTARGAKHLDELARAAEDGARAVMLFLIQRDDCQRLAIAADIDPGYDRALRAARSRGVEAICYSCTVSPAGIELDRPVPLVP